MENVNDQKSAPRSGTIKINFSEQWPKLNMPSKTFTCTKSTKETLEKKVWYCLKLTSGLGNYFVYKRSTVQTLLWTLELAIQINLEPDTIAVWKEVEVPQYRSTTPVVR